MLTVSTICENRSSCRSGTFCSMWTVGRLKSNSTSFPTIGCQAEFTSHTLSLSNATSFVYLLNVPETF